MESKKSSKKLKSFILLVFIVGLIIFTVFYFYTKNKQSNGDVAVNTNANEKNSSWKITQYGNKYGGQLMSYSIEGDKNGLIIVDGGYEDDKDMIKTLNNLIKSHNNNVDAWVLTHYDTDHAGAYMKIREINKDLKVSHLYVEDAPDLETCRINAPNRDDDLALYERYLNLDIKEKEFLHTGDVIDDVIGLKLEVLYAYEDWVDEKMDNLINNGSIVFKLYGNDESIMFCGDVQNKLIGDYLIEKYGEELKSNYLQVPHHGNNLFSDEFYKLVNPEVAFFPAPKWLMFNENNIGWFTVSHYWELLEKSGANIYYFNTSETTITMK